MPRVAFYPGIHQPSDGHRFSRACISIKRLTSRRKPVPRVRIMLDSGAFTEIFLHGHYRMTPEEHARRVFELEQRGIVRILVVVAQDYMCEPAILERTGLTVLDHQRLTIQRYDEFVEALHRLYAGPPPFRVMPVLQGWAADDYVRHLEMYGNRLAQRMWVGVGSVCKRQGDVAVVEEILWRIKEARPDLRLHGFRCEADGFAQPPGPSPSLQRRQHGVVVRGSPRGAERKRLAGSGGLRCSSDKPAAWHRTTSTSVRSA